VRLVIWEVIIGEGSEAGSRATLGDLSHPRRVDLGVVHALSNKFIIGKGNSGLFLQHTALSSGQRYEEGRVKG